MILTGEAAKYAEGFEALDQKIRPESYKSPEMTERDQIHLFQIMMMFERDEGFKNFMKACLILYSEKVAEGNGALIEMLLKMRRL